MTWFAPVLVAMEDRLGVATPDMWAPRPVAGGLGSAIAGPWSWEHASSVGSVIQRAPRQTDGVRLSAPAETLRRMAEAARALDRSESDVWVEAAREWLLRHHPEAPNGGHAPRNAQEPAANPGIRRMREWRAIDDLLETLRDDQPAVRLEPIPA